MCVTNGVDVADREECCCIFFSIIFPNECGGRGFLNDVESCVYVRAEERRNLAPDHPQDVGDHNFNVINGIDQVQ